MMANQKPETFNLNSSFKSIDFLNYSGKVRLSLAHKAMTNCIGSLIRT